MNLGFLLLFQSRLEEMEGSIRERDEIDGAIETKMASLFTRLQQVNIIDR